jgi:hypothetical protein
MNLRRYSPEEEMGNGLERVNYVDVQNLIE